MNHVPEWDFMLCTLQSRKMITRASAAISVIDNTACVQRIILTDQL